MNKALLLSLIHQHGPVSRVELSRLTKLSPSTVSILIEEIMDDGLIHETGTSGSGAGRRMTMIEIKPDGGYVLGLDLAKSRCVLLNLLGEVKAEKAIDLLIGKTQIGEQLPLIINSFLESQGIPMSMVRRIGISVPGRIDESRQRIVSAIPLQVENLPLGTWLEQIYSTPVQLVNDLDAAGFAERYNGVAQGYRTLIYLLIDRNVGAGLVLDNQIYRGSAGKAGKISEFARYSTVQLAMTLKRAYPEVFAESLTPEQTLRSFGELGLAGNSPMQKELDRVLQIIGIYCGNMLQLLNPEQLIIDGWLTENEQLFERLVSWIRRAEDVRVDHTPVKAAFWGDRGPAVGAATLGLHEIFKPMAFES